jgi:hypothetical protein
MHGVSRQALPSPSVGLDSRDVVEPLDDIPGLVDRCLAAELLEADFSIARLDHDLSPPGDLLPVRVHAQDTQHYKFIV